MAKIVTRGNYLKTVTALAVLALLAVAATQLPVIEWLPNLLASLEGHGSWGLVILALLYVVLCVALLPGSLITLAMGFYSATLWPRHPILAIAVGTAVASLSSTTGAIIAFFVGRTFARGWVVRKVEENPRMKALDEAIEQQGFQMVFLVRLSPMFPFNVLNYVLSMSRVRIKDYVLGTWLGMIPGTILYIYMGSIAQNFTALLAGAHEMGKSEIILGILGLAATLAAFYLSARIARNVLRYELPRPKRHLTDPGK